MDKINRFSIVVLALFILSGCSSLTYRALSDGSSDRVYPGVAADAQFVSFGFEQAAEQETVGETALYGVYALGITVYSIVDLPFSLVFDTLLLPYDLSQVING